MDKRNLTIALAITAILAIGLLTAYAVIQWYGQIVTEVPVEQAIWVDDARYNETITETLLPTYGGCTVYANHTLENKGDDDAKIVFDVVNITDGEGDLVTHDSIKVSWIVDGEQVIQPITVSGHTTIEFSIAIHFHYAIMPDTYTIITQVKPYIA